MSKPFPIADVTDDRPWYVGITRYQWLVLAIGAAGWAFDQYEAPIFTLAKDRILLDMAGYTGADRDSIIPMEQRIDG